LQIIFDDVMGKPRIDLTTAALRVKENPLGRFTVFEEVSNLSTSHKTKFFGTDEQQRSRIDEKPISLTTTFCFSLKLLITCNNLKVEHISGGSFMSNVLFGMGFAGSFIVDLWLVSMFQFLIGSEPLSVKLEP